MIFNNFVNLFLAVLGLHCRSGFALVLARGAPLYCGLRASYCGGLSCCGAWALGHVDVSS